MVKGIQNLGLTCAASSLLQVLLTNKLFANEIKLFRNASALCSSLFELLTQYYGTVETVNPLRIYSLANIGTNIQMDVINLIDSIFLKIEANYSLSNYKIIYSNPTNDLFKFAKKI